MANVVVVGSRWGDEGKGKIVDSFSERPTSLSASRAAITPVIPCVVDGTTYKLSLLPSGVVRPGKLSVIGNGVVLDPRALIEEIDRLAAQGVTVTPDNLRIAENVALILSVHQELDAIRENAGATTRIGTTRRGIGPAYEDKVGRRAIRLMDLADLAALDREIERLLSHHNALRRGLGLAEIDPQVLRKELIGVAPRVLPFSILGMVAARPAAPRGQAHSVRGRPGRASRHRPRHLSVRHLVKHRRCPGRDRLRTWPGIDRLRARHLQGLHDPGR